MTFMTYPGLDPRPETRDPKPETRNPKPQTLDPKPYQSTPTNLNTNRVWNFSAFGSPRIT
jgi:hypothetical protein